MASDGVRMAFKNLAKEKFNLLTLTSEDAKKLQFHWATSSKGTSKGKGVWSLGQVFNPTFTLIGMVDFDKSKLGSYGNLFEVQGVPATLLQLKGCKFTLAFTYPELPEDHVDADLVDQVKNQIQRLNGILHDAKAQIEKEDAAEAAAKNISVAVPEETHWVRFVTTDDDYTKGWIHLTIGTVYEEADKKVSGPNVDLSPRKAKPATEKKFDIVPHEDLHKHFAATNYNLRHNESLPCFLPNGERIGRTSSELRRELYQGRWVQVEVELVLWNFTGVNQPKRIFQLHLKRLTVLPAASTAPVPGTSFAPLESKAYITCPPVQGADTSGQKRKLDQESEEGDDQSRAKKAKDA